MAPKYSRSTAELLYGADSDVVKTMEYKDRTQALKENNLRLRELTFAIKMQKAEQKQKDLDAQIAKKTKRDEFLAAKTDISDKMLKDIKKNTDETAKNTKAFLKRSGEGLFKGLKSLLAIGGLIGFLLTGKIGFLSSLAKGLLKYNPLKMVNDLFTFGGQIAKGIKEFAKFGFGLGKNTFKAIGTTFKMIKTLGLKGGLSEAIHSFILDPLKAIFTGVGKKAAPKMLMKGLGKGLGKGAAVALKKIPGIGTLLGLFFGIMRFKEGDTVGGILEIASGIASIFPGVGTVVSMGIDALLLFRDFKKGFGDKKKEEKKEQSFIKHTLEDLKKFPVIGPLIGMTQAIGGVFKDPFMAAQQFATSLDMLLPGLGIGKFIMMNVSVAKAISELPMVKGGFDIAKKGVGAAIGGVKKAFTGTKKTFGEISTILSNSVAPGAAYHLNTPKNPRATTPISVQKGVDVSGVNPAVWNNFNGMVNEYNTKTGKGVQLNSAYRSIDQQKKLFETSPVGYAAPPGRSMHNYGYALDINSREANEMSSLGLMDKWGFNRPMIKEPWHIQPVGISKAQVMSGNIPVVEEKTSGIGDPVIVKNSELSNKNNLPSSKIVRVNNNMTVVALDDNTINKIVEGQLLAAKKYQATFDQTSVIQVNARG